MICTAHVAAYYELIVNLLASYEGTPSEVLDDALMDLGVELFMDHHQKSPDWSKCDWGEYD